MLYYNPDGHPLMEAELRQYELIEGACVKVPREIYITSLENGSWLKLDFSSMHRDDNIRVEPARILRSPLQRGLVDDAEIIYVDRRPPPLPSATQPVGSIEKDSPPAVSEHAEQ